MKSIEARGRLTAGLGASFGTLRSAHFFGATGQEIACISLGCSALRRGQALVGVSDLAGTLPNLHFGMGPFGISRILDADIELKSDYNFCR